MGLISSLMTLLSGEGKSGKEAVILLSLLFLLFFLFLLLCYVTGYLFYPSAAF